MDSRDFCMRDWLRRDPRTPAFTFPADAKIEPQRDEDGRVVALRSPDASAGFYLLRLVDWSSRPPRTR
jgi:hypothetical protein